MPHPIALAAAHARSCKCKPSAAASFCSTATACVLRMSLAPASSARALCCTAAGAFSTLRSASTAVSDESWTYTLLELSIAYAVRSFLGMMTGVAVISEVMTVEEIFDFV
jgi:hypothetical protein